MIALAADARALAIGHRLPRREHAPTRVEIAWYMVASYDLNPIHVDEPFARSAGFPTVIGQGMIPFGYLAATLVAAVGVHRLRAIGGDFVSPVLPDEALMIDVELAERREIAGAVELVWSLQAVGVADGRPRVRGTARSVHEDATPGE